MINLNPVSTVRESYNWNYSKPNEPGYSLELVGTVVAIQQVQAMEFGAGGVPTQPATWPDGNPKWNIRMALCGPNGGIRTWTFQPASKAAKEGKRKSVHLDLFALTGNTDMMNLIGQTLKIETDAPPQGFSYGIGNPRPWRVALVPGTVYTLAAPLPEEFTVPQVHANSAVSGGQVVQQQPQAMPVQAPVAPVQQPVQPVPAPVPVQPQPAVQQPLTAPETPSVYDEDIPF